ncbi:glucan biosynthesis protein [Commensalibacter communis]|uniref:glucan biosynthesis protein n=1 Tax=Commensalibacter communis TaxID=2972786 RepID=UPI0022FF99C5|nr:glucan biosynthesis protein G [Commensalibacter communis]CAI3923336.1 Periplasmic glucan biosynthesis protein OpgG (MdoG) (PDB:1TXK) [Commensalibacter communis]CAI3931357.1 Periplasmic glucan biosynthesis protein OpgG (MdoG) (PDB:1TXK) [Commensalibacter communis]
MVFRRDLLRSAAGISLASVVGEATGSLVPQAVAADSKSSDDDKGKPFDQTTVRQLARDMAKTSYKAPSDKLPDAIDKLDFDGFRSIDFKPESALWHGSNLNFEVQFFPRGFLYRPRIDIYEVVDGISKPVPYNADMFNYKNPKLRVEDNLGFSGFKLMTRLNQKDVFEEFAVFLGASYFRAVSKGQQYGLSARGFAKGTADPQGEEFPLFRSFWIVQPKSGIESLVIYALLDSPSLTGAFRFTIRPGDTTTFDVESYFYPRKTIANGGVAPLTGMFYFDANNRNHVDDWRPAAHDSEGLLMWTGTGEQIWRPLNNPVDLQYSVFMDTAPKGFGLIQRKRDFSQYEDLALHYELRPSLWVEPVGEWQSGSMNLVEIPTPSEVNDNIVAFWRPKQPFKEGGEYSFTYRLYWGWDNPWTSNLARVAGTRIGAVVDKPDVRFFCIDFFDGPLNHFPTNKQLTLNVTSSTGKVSNIVVEANPVTHGWRTTFEFAPENAKTAELKCVLMDGDQPISEKWVYRWTA